MESCYSLEIIWILEDFAGREVAPVKVRENVLNAQPTFDLNVVSLSKRVVTTIRLSNQMKNILLVLLKADEGLESLLDKTGIIP